MEEHKCPTRKKQISAGRCILTSNSSNQRDTDVCVQHFQLPLAFPACCRSSWAAGHCPGTFPGAKARAVPAPSGQSWDPAIVTRTLSTSHSLCTKPALGFPCSLLEEREEELKCSTMRGIFRPKIDAPAIRGRWQPAEELLGVSRMQGHIRFPLRCRCTWSAIPHLAFFSVLFLSHSVFFLVIITDLQDTFSAVHHCFQ